MSEGRLGLVLVMDAAGQMKGLFTDGDLRRALMKSKSFLDDLVDHHMSLSPLTVTGEVRLAEAEELMRIHKVRILIVTNQEAIPIGLVELFDV